MSESITEGHSSFEAWFRANHTESAKDIASHGADTGYHGLVYNRDINAILDAWEGEIEELVEEVYSEISEAFSEYCRRTHQPFSLQALKCWLVYCAAEILAQRIVDEQEDEQESEGA